MQLAEARSLLKGATRLVSAKGKKVVEVDLKAEKLADEELSKLMLGPTGNLRAPTIKVGKTVIVGFSEEVYQAYLG